MELSRQNLILIGVAAGVLALGVGIVWANMAMGKDVDEALAERGILSRKLQNLDGPIQIEGRGALRINQNIVDKERQRVQEVKQALAEVILDCARWNKRNFQVLSATIQGQEIKAFPVDRVASEKGTLPYNLTKAYIAAVDSLLDPLNVAVEVTQDELAAEIPLWEDKLRVSPEFKDLAKEEGQAIIAAAARKRARDALVARSIQGSLIYVEPGALDKRFDRPTEAAKFDAIWDAQVGLWTMQDIVEAIRLTNEKAVANEGNPSVTNSAIKRLVSIRVYGYVTEPPIDSLTGRFCSKQYDVIRYRFTVVMPLRFVPELERELMALNYHTILNVSVAASYVPPDSLFDYGPDPVMRVDFDGELLLLTTWERGTWQPATGDQPGAWSEEFPPLMPIEKLRTLPEADSEPRDWPVDQR